MPHCGMWLLVKLSQSYTTDFIYTGLSSPFWCKIVSDTEKRRLSLSHLWLYYYQCTGLSTHLRTAILSHYSCLLVRFSLPLRSASASRSSCSHCRECVGCVGGVVRLATLRSHRGRSRLALCVSCPVALQRCCGAGDAGVRCCVVTRRNCTPR